MTREEATAYWKQRSEHIHNWLEENEDADFIGEYVEAIDMAIKALQAEPTKAVPPSLAEVYKWERDIALSQLEEYGIGFAEKKRDDLVEVVRCKDCLYKQLMDEGDTKYYYCALEDRPNRNWSVDDTDFCSWGERREE